MRKFIVILFLLVFLSPIESTFGQTPSKFWIRSLEGKRFDSRKEKLPYVLSFFFVNCIPCIKEIPELYKFMNTNFPNVPLLFIDPIKEDSKKDIQRFSEKLKVPSSYFYKDSFGTISKKFFKDKMSFPTIVGIRGNEYLFRFNGIDETILDEIKCFIFKSLAALLRIKLSASVPPEVNIISEELTFKCAAISFLDTSINDLEGLP